MNLRSGLLALAISAVAFPAVAAPPTDAHIKAVKAAVAAYLIDHATNGCPAPAADIHGWPAAKLKECEYALPDPGLGHKRAGYVVLLEIPAAATASWIESACAQLASASANCFSKILSAAQANSGLMFAVAGNVPEDMGGAHTFSNYYFRNGMTTSFVANVNASSKEVSLADQKAAAALGDDKAISIPSGMTRFWRTTPNQMRLRFPDVLSQQLDLKQDADRQTWLALARNEMLRALDAPDNRLLEAWFCAHSADLLADEAAVCKPRLTKP